MINTLCELIRMENPAECLRRTLKIAEEMGFRTHNMDDIVGWAEYGDENAEMVCVLGHLDVVPAGEGWTHEPFGGEISGGRVWGRGAIDDKGPAIAALFAVKELMDSGCPMKRRVRVLFGTAEETGSEDMRYYLEHGGEVPFLGFTPDGNFPLINGEKGIITATYQKKFSTGVKKLSGGTAFNIVPRYACAELADGTKVEAEGVSYHGSQPWEGVNAIGKLFEKLKGINDTFAFLAEHPGTDPYGKSMGIALEDAGSGPLSFCMGVANGDAEQLTVVFNYRYPVTCKYEECEPVLDRLMQEHGFVCIEESHEKPLYFPADAEPVKTLCEVYGDITGLDATPEQIGGGTYAKSIPHIVAFGPVFPGMEAREHEPDEYIDIEVMEKIRKIYKEAVRRLANL